MVPYRPCIEPAHVRGRLGAAPRSAGRAQRTHRHPEARAIPSDDLDELTWYVYTATSLVPANTATLVQTSSRLCVRQTQARKAAIARNRRLRRLAMPKTCLLALKKPRSPDAGCSGRCRSVGVQIEGGGPRRGLRAGQEAPVRCRSTSSTFSVDQKASTTALSQRCPGRSRLWWMPCLSSSRLNSRDGVPAAPIGVEDQARPRPPPGDRHLERLADQLSPHVGGHRPAHHPARGQRRRPHPADAFGAQGVSSASAAAPCSVRQPAASAAAPCSVRQPAANTR